MATDKPGEPRWRLFFALPVPDAATGELWSAIAPLVARHPQARWARREQLHATLVFLGQTGSGEIDRLVNAMQLTAGQHGPFEVITSDAGGRADDRRGGVCWLRLDDRQRRLRNLARELDWRSEANTYVNSRPRPHVTVARRIDAALLADLGVVAHTLRLSWTFDRIGLYRSHPDPGGSRYEMLAEARLSVASTREADTLRRTKGSAE